MLEIDKNTIMEAWNNKLTFDFDGSYDQFNLYVDNPFCRQKCRFCCYAPTILNKKNKAVFNKYYAEILPNCIDDYAEALNIQTPNTVYFGGGTSSVMSSEQMENLFNHLQQRFDFTNGPKEKTFEMNPTDITEDKIEILSKWKFSHVTMGVQSFNANILKYNNRKISSLNSIKKIAQALERHQLMYNMDVMVFIHNNNLSQDLDNLIKDVELLISSVNPLHITIYPNYYYIDPPKNKDIMIESVIALRNIISTLLGEKDNYIEAGNLSKQISREAILKNFRFAHSLLRKDIHGIKEWKRYSCSGWPNENAQQNVLAIGGHGRRKPYSYFGDKFCYQTKLCCEKPIFELVYANSDYCKET